MQVLTVVLGFLALSGLQGATIIYMARRMSARATSHEEALERWSKTLDDVADLQEKLSTAKYAKVSAQVSEASTKRELKDAIARFEAEIEAKNRSYAALERAVFDLVGDDALGLLPQVPTAEDGHGVRTGGDD